MAIQKAGHFGGRILTQGLWETQLVKQHKVPKSAAQRGEVVRPTAVIHTHYEFGKGERHFLNRGQESQVRVENRNSKLEIRKPEIENGNSLRATSPARKHGSTGWWVPAYAGMTCWAVFEFRISVFDFRFSNFEFRGHSDS
jgi:hypothetical protein